MGTVCTKRRASMVDTGQSRVSLLKGADVGGLTVGQAGDKSGAREDEATWDVTALGAEAEGNGEPPPSVADISGDQAEGQDLTGEKGDGGSVAVADGGDSSDLAERLRIQKEKSDREVDKRTTVDDAEIREHLEKDKAKANAPAAKAGVKHFGGMGGLDSDLAARLARQKDKEQSGESAIEAPRAKEEEKEKVLGIDSQLAARFAKQKEKEESGESAVKSFEALRQKEEGTNVDSQLAQRLAKQKEKEQTGESAVESAVKSLRQKEEGANVNSQLAARLAKQKEKEQTGENAIKSPRQKEEGINVDSQLAQRLAKQKEKEYTGESAVDESRQRDGVGIQVDPQLAVMLAKQKEKEKEEEQLLTES